jgi:hypothetical protein
MDDLAQLIALSDAARLCHHSLTGKPTDSPTILTDRRCLIRRFFAAKSPGYVTSCGTPSASIVGIDLRRPARVFF